MEREEILALNIEEVKTQLHLLGYCPVDTLGEEEALEKLFTYFGYEY